MSDHAVNFNCNKAFYISITFLVHNMLSCFTKSSNN